jgi:hypothetical protein
MLSIDTLRSEGLDAAEVGPVDPALVGERLLAQPSLGAQPAHVLRQHVAQRSLVRPRHGRYTASYGTRDPKDQRTDAYLPALRRFISTAFLIAWFIDARFLRTSRRTQSQTPAMIFQCCFLFYFINFTVEGVFRLFCLPRGVGQWQAGTVAQLLARMPG